jgi:hypothetical protein
MRTVVDIPDALHRELESRAAQEGSSTESLILRCVEEALGESPRKLSGKRIKFPIIPAERTGVIDIDNARIYDIISFP